MLFKRLTLVVVALLALAAGFWISSQISVQEPPPIQLDVQANILSPARQIGIPELLKDDGNRLQSKDLQGHWSLMFFGYTHCPDICPTTLQVLKEAKQHAQQADAEPFPQVYFVSVDPERDSAELMHDYVQYFDPSFTGITGDPKMIEALTLQMSVVSMKAPAASGDADDYLVDHSAAVLLLNPEGKLQAFLQPPHSASSILKSIDAITNK